MILIRITKDFEATTSTTKPTEACRYLARLAPTPFAAIVKAMERRWGHRQDRIFFEYSLCYDENGFDAERPNVNYFACVLVQQERRGNEPIARRVHSAATSPAAIDNRKRAAVETASPEGTRSNKRKPPPLVQSLVQDVEVSAGQIPAAAQAVEVKTEATAVKRAATEDNVDDKGRYDAFI